MQTIRRFFAGGLVLAGLSACSTTPSACDMTQPLGACNVRVNFADNRVMVCSDEAAQVCMNAALDVTTSKGYTSRKLMLSPGECRSLGADVASAAQASCNAYAVRANTTREAAK
jgi:hypothetical protein